MHTAARRNTLNDVTRIHVTPARLVSVFQTRAVVQTAAKLMVASFIGLAIAAVPVTAMGLTAPVARADGNKVPSPNPVPVPQPDTTVHGSQQPQCQDGESLNEDGNCTPTMSSLHDANEQAMQQLHPRTAQGLSTTTESGIASDMVPNINGYPCTGYWESVACYETSQNQVPIQPRSTLSSSP